MITAVLDANVLVSSFPGRQGAPAELLERWLAREFQLIISEHILDGAIRAIAIRSPREFVDILDQERRPFS